jgi:hypothetical protein
MQGPHHLAKASRDVTGWADTNAGSSAVWPLLDKFWHLLDRRTVASHFSRLAAGARQRGSMGIDSHLLEDEEPLGNQACAAEYRGCCRQGSATPRDRMQPQLILQPVNEGGQLAHEAPQMDALWA